MIPCGGYADDLTGTAACTGWGEPIIKPVLAQWPTGRLDANATHPDAVVKAAVAHLGGRLRGQGVGFSHNTPRMAWALRADRAACGIERPATMDAAF